MNNELILHVNELAQRKIYCLTCSYYQCLITAPRYHWKVNILSKENVMGFSFIWI